jgi:hypothetical protein
LAVAAPETRSNKGLGGLNASFSSALGSPLARVSARGSSVVLGSPCDVAGGLLRAAGKLSTVRVLHLARPAFQAAASFKPSRGLHWVLTGVIGRKVSDLSQGRR